jgi:hypothetical protein
MEMVKKTLAENGKSHIFIDEKTLSTKDTSMSAYLMDHFRSFHPEQVCLSWRASSWIKSSALMFDRFSRARKAGTYSLTRKELPRMPPCSMA